MKPWAKRWLVLICCCGLLLACGAVALLGLGYWLYSGGSPAAQQATAMDCTLEWGRLAPFPASAGVVSVTTEGGSFTRAFRASFTAPATEIEKWLKDSPGTREGKLTKPSPGLRHFEIQPGGGAAHAEVTVDDSTHRVSIYVYWS